MVTCCLLLSGVCFAPLILARPASTQRVPSIDAGRGTAEAPSSAPFVIEGFVLAPDGMPAEGAVVVSSAGGKALVDRNGHYQLEAEVPLDAHSVEITAFGSTGGNESASTRVAVSAASGLTRVDPISLVLGDCQPRWLPTFQEWPGTNGSVRALVVYDDGHGPALYVGGSFTNAGGAVTNGIAKWDGSRFQALGSGMDGSVHALTVYDDGGGAALYAGGSFSTAGGVPASRIAKWNGSNWSALGSGLNSDVYALAVYDGGGGPGLYAGGALSTAGGVSARRIARWDGSTWSALGSGLTQGSFGTTSVLALAVYGSELYVGGDFMNAGGLSVRRIAKWNGSSWSPLGGSGGGVWQGGGTDPTVNALAVYDDGLGPKLYAGGNFGMVDSLPVDNIAKWNGSLWSGLGSGLGGSVDGVAGLAVHDDGGGPALYASTFDPQPHSAANEVAKWDGSSWSALGSGMSGSVFALAVYDDGGGPSLYAGGAFTTASGVAAWNIARWDDSTWVALVRGRTSLDGLVSSLATFDDGSGPKLCAGGQFTAAGEAVASRIAEWDGVSWAALGSGMVGSVQALTMYDDGGGPALYAGGDFTTAGGVAANDIAKWDGLTWSALGSGLNDRVSALAVHDDGSGPVLCVGGAFWLAGGVAADDIAKWNGSSWSATGTGTSNSVNALTVFDDGSGPGLYLAGNFTAPGGRNHIVRWDGSTSWTALGSGMNSTVRALTVYDDGSGPTLYAGGEFTTAGGVAANRIAKWDGSSWAPLGGGANGTVSALAVYDDGDGPALYAGGSFTALPDAGDSYLARWRCPLITLDRRVRVR